MPNLHCKCQVKNKWGFLLCGEDIMWETVVEETVLG